MRYDRAGGALAFVFAVGCSEVVANGGVASPDGGDPGDRPPLTDAGADAHADDGPPDAELVTSCLDEDLDGYGRGAACRGPDCDDRDPRVTSPCAEGCGSFPDVREGCPCAPGSMPLPCDLTTGRSEGIDGVCNPGQRACADHGGGRWLWGYCERWRSGYPGARYVGAVSACPGSCLPTCRRQVICPTPDDPPLPSTAGLRIGASTAAVFCPRGTARGGLTPTCQDGRCAPGEFTRVFEGDCAPTGPADRNLFSATLPYWGLFNFAADVPVGTSIQFELRAADTLAGLGSAAPIRLADAPVGSGASPVSVRLRDFLRAASRPGNELWLRRYLQLTARLTPALETAIAPTLVALEVQYSCLAIE